MAENVDTRKPDFDASKAQIEIVAEVPLTKEQTDKIKADIGVEVSTLIIQHISRAAARAENAGNVSVLRLTWCW